jgi:ribosome biogenesis protein Tsr3
MIVRRRISSASWLEKYRAETCISALFIVAHFTVLSGLIEKLSCANRSGPVLWICTVERQAGKLLPSHEWGIDWVSDMNHHACLGGYAITIRSGQGDEVCAGFQAVYG